jgi:putative transposase
VKAHPFIGAEKAAGHGIARACRLLKVSRAAYYQRRAGGLSPRAAADAAITARISSIHTESRAPMGPPASTGPCAATSAAGSGGSPG